MWASIGEASICYPCTEDKSYSLLSFWFLLINPNIQESEYDLEFSSLKPVTVSFSDFTY